MGFTTTVAAKDGDDDIDDNEDFCIIPAPSRDVDGNNDGDEDDDEAKVVRVVSKALNWKLSTSAAVAPITACVCGKATATTVTVFVILSDHWIMKVEKKEIENKIEIQLVNIQKFKLKIYL